VKPVCGALGVVVRPGVGLTAGRVGVVVAGRGVGVRVGVARGTVGVWVTLGALVVRGVTVSASMATTEVEAGAATRPGVAESMPTKSGGAGAFTRATAAGVELAGG